MFSKIKIKINKYGGDFFLSSRLAFDVFCRLVRVFVPLNAPPR